MKILRKGDRGQEVKYIQQNLSLAVDGIFGKITEEAVKKFQAENGIVADGIVGDDTWCKFPTKIYTQRYETSPNTNGNIGKSKRNIKEIIIHCTDTPAGKSVSIQEIRRWHKARGFSDVGYHYVIDVDGTVMTGRNIDLIGAHCTGHNANSIGLCYVGGRDKAGPGFKNVDTRTDAQKASLLKVIKEIKKHYPGAKVHGHREFAAKACPCFDVQSEYKNL